MRRVGYYPGCRLSGEGARLDRSIRAVACAAEVDLVEIQDWNCCGATAAKDLTHQLAVALPYRTLALAQEQGVAQLLAPCAACFSRLKGTHVRVKRSAELANQMAEVTERTYDGSVQVINIDEFLQLLLEAGLADRLPKRLTGLKVAAYYGCLLSRDERAGTDVDGKDPIGMAGAIRATGAETVAWDLATECCGGGFRLSRTSATQDLSGQILRSAAEAGAAVVVVACPTCYANLDLRQGTAGAAGPIGAKMPVLYLSELLALAAGLAPEDMGLGRRCGDTMGLVKHE